MSKLRIALASAAKARGVDDDLPPLLTALAELEIVAEVVDWDARDIDWSVFDAVVLRSTWDYAARVTEFLDWADAVSTRTQLFNPADVVRWNIDKHYLSEIANAGIATVPSRYIEPQESVDAALRDFLEEFADAHDFVVKPCIGAGSRDARRHARVDVVAATSQIDGLLGQSRSVLLQPYLDRVDSAGETALIYFDGFYSHAIRKGPLLTRGADSTDQLFAPEQIEARQPDVEERALADRVITAIPHATPLLYTRVDLIRGANGDPLLLELELVEPSLFFAHDPGSAQRFAAAIASRVR
ncbi:MAG: hypothetical protein WBP11_02210 [Dokdonella sp.]